VFDAAGGQVLPGRLVRGEGDPRSKDAAVNEAYDGAGSTYDLYFDVYGRNSIDDRGMRLDATVHFGREYDNAFWDGRQMVYGDGDGEIFRRFTRAFDVIGHELTHGVTQFEAALAYEGESGALAESISDVFGVLVLQRRKKLSAARADWLVGRGLFTARVHGEAIRSMKAPGTAYDDPVLGRDPQPAHMKDFVRTLDDNGGVHVNSGIANRAFYETAVRLGGFAWENAGRIWYLALRDRLRRDSGFREMAATTLRIARDTYGRSSREARCVREGWSEVGLDVP
jgi:Zn-dependent metalloprotease